MRFYRKSPIGRLILVVGVFWSINAGMTFSQDAPTAAGTEKIGEVFGKSVSRSDLGEKSSKVKDKLHELILVPVAKRYQELHKKEFEPTEEEVAWTTEFFKKAAQEIVNREEPESRKRIAAIQQQLDRSDLTAATREALQQEKDLKQKVLEVYKNWPARDFAVLKLTSWKFERHLYDNYGGGCILWQQGGVEAFDATRKWLEAREKAGDFKITDEKLRAKFYAYWTTQYHGQSLIDDSETIEQLFLKPDWVYVAPKTPNEKK